MNCPKCGAPADSPDANFCEDCGAPLAPAAEAALPPAAAMACENCGAGPGALDAAGFCGSCGVEQRIPNARDHLEITPSPRLAGVCDRGLKHRRNEDFLAAAAAGALCVAVVCDGVSDTPGAEDASAIAAPLVCEFLLANADPAGEPETVLREALARAQTAVKALAPQDRPEDAPASTAVAAVVRGREATLAWLGDSRAYFLAADGNGTSRLLTKDHSWVNDVVDAGQLTLAEARGRRGAHTVTRTLGGPPADPEKGDDEPSFARVTFPGPGWLLLCSDGLWNYAEEPAELLAHLRPGDDALGFARRLVEHANACGGRDNITAVLLKL